MSLTVADLDRFTIGMLNDLALYRIEEDEDEDEDEARDATQADFDAF